MNHNRNPVFTAENIIAILEAAPHGGTTQEVLERAKVPISHSSLDKWIKDGRRDLRNEKQTAYRLFAEQWDTVYPGAPPRNEAARMEEMQKALAALGIQVPKTCASSSVSEGSRPKKPRTTCECGNAKEPGDECCQSCAGISSPEAADKVPAGAAA